MIFKYWFKCAAFLIVASIVSRATAGSYDDFFAAVANDNAAVVTALLERGFDPNTVSPQGQSPLYLALQVDSLKVAEVLWRHPTLQVDASNPLGETPLMMAALRGRIDWCERLVARGAAVNRSGWTPLHYAASGSEPKVVEWLLARGAAVDALSPNGTTPLMMAAGYGPEAAADVLLQHGASVDKRNAAGMSAGDFARRAGRDGLASRLLEKSHQ
jgi:ankyrin repeat protein